MAGDIFLPTRRTGCPIAASVPAFAGRWAVPGLGLESDCERNLFVVQIPRVQSVKRQKPCPPLDIVARIRIIRRDNAVKERKIPTGASLFAKRLPARIV